MSSGHGAEELATQAAEVVRRVVTEAEARAEQIVRDAEADAARIRELADAKAAQIREKAEADARDQIEAARRALDELGGSLAAAVSAAAPGAEAPAAQTEAEPEPQPETAVQPAAPAGNGDDAAQRLVAMKLAVEGRERSEIEAELTAKFGEGDRSALLDDVLSRVSR